jgi:hypothetical protein
MQARPICGGLHPRRCQLSRKVGLRRRLPQIRDDVLYPGVRPRPGTTPDMCTPAGRPTALQPTGARRVAG